LESLQVHYAVEVVHGEDFEPGVLKPLIEALHQFRRHLDQAEKEADAVVARRT
jgi:hypothetical protein